MLTTDRIQRATVALQMAEFATNVGRRLRELREERKAQDPRWTQDYAARQVRDDLTGAQYARWERGEVLPREETLERLAEVFGVPVETFYAGRANGDAPDLMAQFSEDPLAAIRRQLSEMQTALDDLYQLVADRLAILDVDEAAQPEGQEPVQGSRRLSARGVEVRRT